MISILVFAAAIVVLSLAARWLQQKDLYARAHDGPLEGVDGKAGLVAEGEGGKEVESEEEVGAGEKVV